MPIKICFSPAAVGDLKGMKYKSLELTVTLKGLRRAVISSGVEKVCGGNL